MAASDIGHHSVVSEMTDRVVMAEMVRGATLQEQSVHPKGIEHYTEFDLRLDHKDAQRERLITLRKKNLQSVDENQEGKGRNTQ
jgi:hypothetical protein